MLDPKELKIVVSTLTKRRAWIKKALEDTALDPAARKENVETMRLLDSAVQKLASSAARPKSTPPKPTAAAVVSNTTPKIIPLEKAKVLIAEDNESSAELLLDILKDFGLKLIDLAKDGIETFDKIKRAETPYDIILCDWEMPELSGLEVHNKAKSSNTLGKAHFIMVTANSEASHIKKAVSQGINDYIVKPIDVDILEGKIRTALGLPAKEGKQEA